MAAVLIVLCGCHAAGGIPGAASELRDPLGDGNKSKHLYAALCASCHGDDGRGRTQLAGQLEPRPGDLQGCNFKYRSTGSGTLPTDSDLLRTLAVGIPGTRMPAFAGIVAPRSLELLVGEIKRRCRLFSEEQPGEQIPPPGRPLVDEKAAARGRVIFENEKCGICHGEQGRGDGPAAGGLRDTMGRKIRPRDFTQGIFRSGHALIDVYRAFSTGLNGTPMPAMLDSVPAAERWDLAEYLASLGRDHDGRPRRPAPQPPFLYSRLLVWGASSTD